MSRDADLYRLVDVPEYANKSVLIVTREPPTDCMFARSLGSNHGVNIHFCLPFTPHMAGISAHLVVLDGNTQPDVEREAYARVHAQRGKVMRAVLTLVPA